MSHGWLWITFYEFFSMTKNLNNETSKLKNVILTPMKHIVFLENKNDNLIEEINQHRSDALTVNYVSILFNNKYGDCEILESKIEDMHETQRKFIKWRDNLNIILENNKGMYILA